MNKIWKPVVLDGFHFPYYVNNFGEVKNKHGKILKHQKRGQRKGNYLCVTLCKNGRIKRIDVHRLVALHFVPNPKNKPEVNHLDCDQYNPKADNLEWCTRSENENHKRFMMAHREFVDEAV